MAPHRLGSSSSCFRSSGRFSSAPLPIRRHPGLHMAPQCCHDDVMDLTPYVDTLPRELAPGSVDVRLRGLDPDFVVTLPPTDGGAPAEPAAPVEPLRTPAPADGEEGGTA